ncbi:MAG: hypothetical protein V3R64_00835 [Sphingomonadales bacterium]
MSEFNFKITSYSIHLGERAEATALTQNGDEVTVTINSVLTCRGDEGERIAVYFYRPGAGQGALKSSHHMTKEKKPSAIIWEDQANYPNYVDLVRNESPIWGYIETGKDATEVRLYTGRWEPVGVGDEDYGSDPTR